MKIVKSVNEITAGLGINGSNCASSFFQQQPSTVSQQQCSQQQQQQQPSHQQLFQQTYHQPASSAPHPKPRGSFIGGARGTAYQQTRPQQHTDAKAETEFDEALKLIDGI